MTEGVGFALPTWAELARLAPTVGIVLVIQAITIWTTIKVIRFA